MENLSYNELQEREVENLKNYKIKKGVQDQICSPRCVSAVQKWHCSESLRIEREINRCDRRTHRHFEKELCLYIEKKVSEMILSRMEWKENRMTDILNNILKNRGEAMIQELHEIVISKINDLGSHASRYNEDGTRKKVKK